MYDTYHTCNKVLKAQLLDSVNHLYISDLHDNGIGFASVTTLTILTHLWATYGVINNDPLRKNLEKMTTTWSPPPISIETLFTQLKNCQKLAEKVSTFITDSVVICTGVQIVKGNGLFDIACRKWRA